MTLEHCLEVEEIEELESHDRGRKCLGSGGELHVPNPMAGIAKEGPSIEDDNLLRTR